MNGSKLVPIVLVCIAMVLLAPRSVGSAPGDTERISVGNNGSQGSQQSLYAAVSDDGRYVAFESYAALIPQDTNNQLDIYVRDRQTDQTMLVSVSSTGTLANSYSYKPALSADGRFVAFESSATNLVSGGVYVGTHIYVRDRDTDTDGTFDEPGAIAVARLDAPLISWDRARAGPSSNSSISADGRFVAFDSHADGLVPGDTNNQLDIFVRDRDIDEDGIFDEPGASTTFRVNLGGGALQANGESRNPSISDDGRFVAFHSQATNLVVNDSNNLRDVFLHDRESHITTRVSTGVAASQPDFESAFPSISGDGRFVAFHSRATNLVTLDTNNHFDIFVYDRVLDVMTRVSVSSSGEQANQGSLYPSISPDGNYVAFQSAASNLSVEEDGGWEDIFVHKRDTGVTALASRGVDDATTNGHSAEPSLSSDGLVVAFESSATNLVPNETNTVRDIFAHEPEYPLPPEPGSADLSLTMSTHQQSRPGGRYIVFNVTAQNNGTVGTRGTVTASLPEQAMLIACSDCEQTNPPSLRLNLPPGRSATMSFEVHVNAWVTNGTEFSSTAQVTSPDDPNEANNSATATIASPEATKRPLIIVPGVAGTRLFNSEGEQWIAMGKLLGSPGDDHLRYLRLGADGESPYLPSDPRYTSMHPGDIIREELGTDVYKSTVEELSQRGYREGVDLFVYPYDWRKDNALAGEQLRPFISNVLAQTETDKVDIMAHSMGGLVTFSALADPATASKVRKVLTLGTPVLGAPKALGIIEFRGPCFIDGLPVCPINEGTLQDVARNLLGVYQLLPSRNFDQAVGPAMRVEEPFHTHFGLPLGDQYYNGWTDLVKRNRNAALVLRADTFHQNVEAFDPIASGVELRRYIGTGLNTPYRFRFYTWCFLWIFNCNPSLEIINGSGDGTVPDNSADVYDADTGFDLRNGATNRHWREISHAGLPVHDVVLAEAYSYFNNSSGPPPDSEEEPLDGIEIEIIGPIGGHIFDPDDPTGPRSTEGQVPQDNYTPFPTLLGRNAPGWNPEVIWETLSGGQFNEFFVGVDGERYGTQSFFLNDEGAYRAQLGVEESEPGRLRVRSYGEDAINGQAVFNIVEAQAGATLQLDFETGQDLSTLRLILDPDGDGPEPPETVEPDTTISGPSADDQQPPVTTASATNNDDGSLTITLSAQDEAGGSGVAETHYLLAGATEPQRYTGPFTLPQGQTVQFASVDNAGNTEIIKEYPASTPTQQFVYLPLVKR